MPRKGHIAKRVVAPDPVYGSELVTKFVNSMMWGGKKSTAQSIFYQAMKNLEEKGGGDDALKLFKKAVENCKPLLEVKTRRVGGANYQVPIEVNPDRRTSLAIRWLISYGRGRGEKGMTDKLSNELLDAANGRGGAMKKKEDVHRMAEANRAFAHYRW
ncbi:MAG: 30S ribosomal protein S7 [Terracidiphilus sp.]|jgi:small subunit ribosomal protein S7